MGCVVDHPGRGEPEREVDQDEDPDLSCDRPRVAIDRMVDPARRRDDAEHPEDRARGTDGRGLTAEREAGNRAGRRAGQVEDQEPERAVPAFDEGPDDPQRPHVEGEMQPVGVDER